MAAIYGSSTHHFRIEELKESLGKNKLLIFALFKCWIYSDRMTDIFDVGIPQLDVVTFPENIDERKLRAALRIFHVGEAVFQQARFVKPFGKDIENPLLKAGVPHAVRPNTELYVILAESNTTLYGTRFESMMLGVSEGGDDMAVEVERRRLPFYDIDRDPFAGLIMEYFESHLGQVPS